MAGVFIVFEGIDGSGKGTQMLRAASWIYKFFGRSVLLTREPGRSDYGVRVREIMGSESDPYKQKVELALAFIGDRELHCKNLLRPAVESGAIVLCDRFKHSTIAFQGAQGIPMEELIGMHPPLPIPDLTLVFDLPVAVARERIRSANRGKLEMFESDPQFMEQLRQNYLSLGRYLPGENIQVIDATPSVDVVEQRVREAITPYLDKIK